MEDLCLMELAQILFPQRIRTEEESTPQLSSSIQTGIQIEKTSPEHRQAEGCRDRN
jgi:hypothetical protein